MRVFSCIMSSIVKIDGSSGQGGGQVLRIALSLSALYGIPVEVTNIRAGRPKPGLSAQHLKGVELVKEMCNANVKGASLQSTSLEFHPGQLHKQRRQFEADIQTAGCISLLAQIALPCALFFPGKEPVTLILKGGTNVPMGPHIEYLTEVFRPLLNKFGADFDFTVLRRGYYPKGGGEVHLHITPVKNLNAVALTDPGEPRGVTGWAYVAGCVNINEANKMINETKATIIQKLDKINVKIPISIEAYREDRSMAVGNGSGLNIVCQTTSDCIYGGSGMGSGRNEESSPGVTAANEIINPILNKSCVDEHTQDQMVILMALAKGFSRFQIGNEKLTSHTETAIKVAETMLGNRGLHFNIVEYESNDGSCYALECEGCGLINESF